MSYWLKMKCFICRILQLHYFKYGVTLMLSKWLWILYRLVSLWLYAVGILNLFFQITALQVGLLQTVCICEFKLKSLVQYVSLYMSKSMCFVHQHVMIYRSHRVWNIFPYGRPYRNSQYQISKTIFRVGFS